MDERLERVRDYAERLAQTDVDNLGSMFFQDAPSTRNKARAVVRRDVGRDLLELLKD